VVPVRYEMNFYILFIRNLVFRGLSAIFSCVKASSQGTSYTFITCYYLI
jgi:hypothetical protein